MKFIKLKNGFLFAYNPDTASAYIYKKETWQGVAVNERIFEEPDGGVRLSKIEAMKLTGGVMPEEEPEKK